MTDLHTDLHKGPHEDLHEDAPRETPADQPARAARRRRTRALPALPWTSGQIFGSLRRGPLAEASSSGRSAAPVDARLYGLRPITWRRRSCSDASDAGTCVGGP